MDEERIDLIVVEKRRAGGVGIAVLISLVLHSFLVFLFLRGYQPAVEMKDTPIPRYVELMQQNPREFVEAPGPKLDRAPSPTAPLSDGNRKASGPNPTDGPPTNRPGDGGGLYTPPANPAPPGPQPSKPAPAVQQQAQAPTDSPSEPETTDTSRFTYREPVRAAAGQGVDWKSAIKEVGKIASLGGGQGVDLSGIVGGERGSYEQGPLSFETQWYDWGDYAQSMVSKIRVNWYANMPQIIRTGMKGVVTIRFTIQRDGRITSLEIVSTSDVPPYDFAAKKAIELSSPLNPLPKDFPNPSERVTAAFYYNLSPPVR